MPASGPRGIIRQDVLVDGVLRSPRELVADDDVDVQKSLESGPRLRCFDFAADTNIVGMFASYFCRKLESTDAPNLLLTVRGVDFALGAR